MASTRKKIVIPRKLALTNEQIERLKSLGELVLYEDLPESADEWLKRCRESDIICTGKHGLKEKIYELKDVFISLPFVAVGWIDKDKLKERNIVVASSPGCNKEAVAEWVMGMMIALVRKFPQYMNAKELPESAAVEREKGLAEKKVCILGKGNVGSRVGELCKAFKMNCSYFKRGDDLYESVKDADIVVNALGGNPSTEDLLDKKFFQSLKQGSYFITVTGDKLNDIGAMIEEIDRGILAGAASDVGSALVGDIKNPNYMKLANHPKVIATPHIAYKTDVAAKSCYDAMIDNIEAYLKGKPINMVE